MQKSRKRIWGILLAASMLAGSLPMSNAGYVQAEEIVGAISENEIPAEEKDANLLYVEEIIVNNEIASEAQAAPQIAGFHRQQEQR